VGTSSTPTPRGRFAIAERIEMNNPGNFLGPIVLPITGYSEVLNEFAGGDGRVAIHGTSAPQLIGTSVSHAASAFTTGTSCVSPDGDARYAGDDHGMSGDGRGARRAESRSPFPTRHCGAAACACARRPPVTPTRVRCVPRPRHPALHAHPA